MIKQYNHKELIQLKEKYNNTDTLQLKRKVITIIRHNKINYDQLAALLQVTKNTIQSYGKKTSKNKPDLYNLLILASYLNIDIEEFFKD